jgi:hypothetical protein
MARVTAKCVLVSEGGLRIASPGETGTALRNHKPSRKENIGKVPVRWDGRKKVYWHMLASLRFDKCELHPTAYVSGPEHNIDTAMALGAPLIPKPVDYSFGANLRLFRVRRGFSQQKLVDRMRELTGRKISQTAVSFWERHKAAPRGEYLDILSEALRVPPFMFFLNFNDGRWMRAASECVKEFGRIICEEMTF